MKQLAALSSALLNDCLSAISGTDAIVIGGQALAYWADYYNLDWQGVEASVTKDLDVFGNSTHLINMSRVLHVSPIIQNPRFISALVGTIEIPLSAELFTNIDVVHTVAGLNRDDIRRHAVNVDIGGFNCLFMHPLHVLESRLKNIEKIPQKRDPQGYAQAALAVRMVHAYIAQRAASAEESAALKAIEKVVSLGKVAAGKLVAKQGINLIDAIPFEHIQNVQFHAIRKKQIINELAHLA
ncbi:hypothetical protein [Methylophilus sp. 14]|uniref:hypothetical protein n=1 Tax=Methylophilus sp. 14 TaxID=2781019 RepID=UPI00188F084E|nr:hypothetical protein [Methylophilus sp. 14]MBF4987117.1 hypothetical protein [Methylophilus sp. 14]